MLFRYAKKMSTEVPRQMSSWQENSGWVGFSILGGIDADGRIDWVVYVLVRLFEMRSLTLS